MQPTTPPLGIAGLFASTVERRVTHIRLSGSYNAFHGAPSFEHITELAGPGWRASRAQVVADIERGWRYYTDESRSPRAYLEVMPPKAILGPKYVRTKPDCARENNLLSLPLF